MTSESGRRGPSLSPPATPTVVASLATSAARTGHRAAPLADPPVGDLAALWAPPRQRPEDAPPRRDESSLSKDQAASSSGDAGFQERIERMVTELADRVGDALAGHGRLRGLGDALAAVAQEASLPATLRRAVESARRLADAEYGAITILGPDGQIRDLVQVGLDASAAARLGPPPSGPGPVGATSHREPFDLPAGHPALDTSLGMPIAVHGETFGGLYLGGKRGGGPFTRQDEELLRALTAAVGVAVENARLRDEALRQRAWHAASCEITAALVAVSEPWAALDLVASRARQVTAANLAAIVLRDPATGLVVTNADGLGAASLRGRHLPAERSPLLEVMRAGQARVVAGPQLDDLFGPDAGELGLGCVMVVPMAAAGPAVGGLLLAAPPGPGSEASKAGAPAPGVPVLGLAAAAAAAVGRAGGVTPFSDLDLRMATAFAGQAALTLELNRLQRDRERLAVFEDRDRIARDLHDVVIQRLFATGLQLQGMTRTMAEPVAARVQDAVGELDQTITELRHTIFSLSSRTRDGAALRAEIERIAGQAEHSLGLRPAVKVEGQVERVPVVVHPHLLAALREALSNIARHSRATQVQVLVRVSEDDVLVEVRDDGVGPSGAGVTSGLANLRSRAHDLGGRMEFGPGPGGLGTRVRWQVPTAAGGAPTDWGAGPAPPGLPRP